MGRRAELAVLHDVLREATAGKGGVLLVAGDPGLGKTRLVSECRKLFMAWVGAASGRLPLWLEARATSYASSSPYGLYQQLLAAWVGVVPEEGDEVVRAALERAMKAVFGGKAGDDQLGLLSQMMGLGLGDAGPALARLPPEALQRSTFEAVRALVSRLLAHGPAVLVLEDLHWADPTSLHLTEELSSLVKEGPLLLVLTRRPEPDPGVSALEAALGADQGLRVRRLELSPLAQSDERDLARSLLGEGAPDDVVDAVSEGAEGNPFFLEERLLSLLGTGALVRGEAGWQLDHAAPRELPEALERLVRSRVDRLGAIARETIVAASVLGAEFSLSTVAAVSAVDGELPQTLAELCSAGLITRLRQLPEPTFRFRHALIQDATYKGLLRGQRRQLHAKAAFALEGAAAGRLEEVAGLLGHHFAMAGEPGRAVHYLELAGDHAASAFANDEAVASYLYGLDLLGKYGIDKSAPGRDTTVNAETELRLKLALVLSTMGRYAEARETLQDGLRGVGRHDQFQAAGSTTGLGWVELGVHEYDAAISAFEAAGARFGNHPEASEPGVFDLWLDSQLGLGQVHYWRDEPDQMAAVLGRVSPVIGAPGVPRRKQADYYRRFSCGNKRSDVTVSTRRSSRPLEGPGGSRRSVPAGGYRLGRFQLGLLLAVVRRPGRCRRKAHRGPKYRRAHWRTEHASAEPLLPQPARPSAPGPRCGRGPRAPGHRGRKCDLQTSVRGDGQSELGVAGLADRPHCRGRATSAGGTRIMACHQLAAVPLDLPMASDRCALGCGPSGGGGRGGRAAAPSSSTASPRRARGGSASRSEAWEREENDLARERLGVAVELAQRLRYA